LNVKDEVMNEIEAIKLHILRIEEECRSQKFNLDKHTQIIREYELK
jgi:hypothetical protein